MLRAQQIFQLLFDRREAVRRTRSPRKRRCRIRQRPVEFRFCFKQWSKKGWLLGQHIAAKAVFNVDGESPKRMYLRISQHELLPLLLELKQLMNNIQVNGNTCTERNAEQQEHHPYLVLNAEPTPPLCDPSVHRATFTRSPQQVQELWLIYSSGFYEKDISSPGG